MHNPGEMNSERHYFALIGDIIDSRHEQDRYDVQKKLQLYTKGNPLLFIYHTTDLEGIKD